MKLKTNRRSFIKLAAVSGASFGLSSKLSPLYGAATINDIKATNGFLSDTGFVPRRAASWWSTLEDLQWSQKKIVDDIKRRADGFAEAGIDTAINFGFHIRFDFSNYFGQLHGYFANVCEELHQRNIKFMDHYSCNHVERPKNIEEYKKLHRGQRHHVLLFHDPIAAKHAQYEGHLFQEITEIDLIDGSRGYAKQYQMETFCHNNPGFLDMHKKYLQRLVKEVPFDGIEVDDMCMYAGLNTCGCKHCRTRLKKDFDREIPPFEDKSFWGNTNQAMLKWGNYENPAFRDWLKMKTDSIVDHLKMVKGVIGDRSLMSCCSSTGPVILNNISLDLEKMAPYLDFFMLENVGTNIKSVNWAKMDAEALHQKDIANKRGNAPAMALSYTIYEKGAYLGWSLSRFWGVGNWASTLNYRLEEDPADAMEMEDVIGESNRWELQHSNLDHHQAKDLIEVRLVSNKYCRENGWRDESGAEHWDRAKAWSFQLLKSNIGYRFLRADELEDSNMLIKESTPLILDGVACVSDQQMNAIKNYLAKGGIAWLAMPFGTHDEKGFKRNTPLSAGLLKSSYKNLIIVDTAAKSTPLERLIAEKKFSPVIKQVSGDAGWTVKMRLYNGELVLHLMNTAITAVPHATVKDNAGVPILADINSMVTNNKLAYEINTSKLNGAKLSIFSPELKEKSVPVQIRTLKKGAATIEVDLTGIKLYAVIQKSK
jgi:hypothetical protein